MHISTKMKNERQINLLKSNLENQLTFIEEQLLPDKDIINKDIIQEQVGIAYSYLGLLKINKVDITPYQLRIKQINKYKK